MSKLNTGKQELTRDPESIDESELRWRVWSFSGRKEEGTLKEYLVELRTEKGLNKCSCEHFQCRIQPTYNSLINHGLHASEIKLEECKHLRAARTQLGMLYSYDLIDAAYDREKALAGL